MFEANVIQSLSDFSIIDLSLSLIFSFALALMIFLLYRRIYHGITYSDNFALSLSMMPMITSLAIFPLPITSCYL